MTSQGGNTAHGAELNVNNLTGFTGIESNDNTPQESFRDAVIVIFDLDTTDVGRDREICQISAWCNGNIFNEYIIPEINISPIASRANGLKIREVGNERRLFHNGNEVNAVCPRDGLLNFLKFLSIQTGQVLLVAHSCFTFDGKIIVRQMNTHNLIDTFQSHVLGFVDTIPIFRLLKPGRNNKYSLKALATDYLEASSIPEQRHAAVNVDILLRLLTANDCTDSLMKQHAKSLSELNLN